MTVQVSIKGFQSAYDIQFPVKGLTSLVGSNYIGKSSVFRAVHGALRNRSGNNFISHKKKSSEVTLVFEPDSRNESATSVTWSKVRNKGASYIVDEVPHKHVGHGTPDFLAKVALGDLTYSHDSTKQVFDPLFSAQFDLPFLLFEPGSRVTKFFSSLLQFDAIGSASKRCSKELRDLKTELNGSLKYRDTLEASVKSFSGLEGLVPQVASLELNLDTYETSKEVLDSLNVYQSLDNSLSESSLRMQEVAGVLDSQLSKDFFDTAVTAWSTLMQIQEFKSNEWVSTVSVPSIPDLQLLEYLGQEAMMHYELPKIPSKGIRFLEYLQVELALVGRSVPVVPDTSLLEYIMSELFLTQYSPQLWERTLKVAKALEAVAEYYLIELEVLSSQEELFRVQAQLESSERTLQDTLEELGVCPLCGRGS